MAQRFGRNRRRAAREAVAKAEREASGLRAEAHRLRAEAHRLRAEAHRFRRLLDDIRGRIVAALGPHTGLLPLDLLPTARYRVPCARMVIERDLDGFIVDELPLTGSTAFEVLSVDLAALVVVVEEDPARFRKLIRFYNEYDGLNRTRFSERVLMCSEEFLRDIGLRGDREELARLIADQLITVKRRAR